MLGGDGHRAHGGRGGLVAIFEDDAAADDVCR